MESRQQKDAAARTRLVVATTLILLSLYDLVIYAMFRGPASVSTAIGLWLSEYWWFCCVYGFVFGHLTAMMPAGAASEPWRWLVVFSLFSLGAALTKWVG